MSRAVISEEQAWALLVALSRRASAGCPLLDEVGVRLDERGALVEGPPADGWIVLRPQTEPGWSWPEAPQPELASLFDLYLPLCVGARSARLVVGHLAQSLDGRIATVSGASQFITGHDDLLHTHRMRALCDAVIVGARTVRADNPQLTTRRAPGPNPVRVVIDPARRLGVDYRVFQDGASPTLLLCSPESAARAPGHGRAEVVPVEAREGQLPVAAILDALRQRGLTRVFVEGGGVTVSRFLQARALTRLQVAVAPVLFGSGRSAIALPEIEDLSEALPLEVRHFPMGRDLLFDCRLG